MRSIRTALPAALLAACTSAQRAPSSTTALPQAGTKGIELGDLDRKADPCDDFAQFANGKWRADNPIPASMDRWSRRWAAGETNKGQLRDILDEVAKKSDWPRGSVEQLVGDHYASCMDEGAVDAAGVKPLTPLLAELDALADLKGVQRLVWRLNELAVPAPFALFGAPDNHQPARTILTVAAAGLGLPDRDYYFKTEPRFAETREKYLQHVAAIFRLAGEPEAKAKQDAETAFAFEKRLAEASLDNVALRDPSNTDHKATFAELKARTPHFDWDLHAKQAGLLPADLNIAEPKFLDAVERELVQTPPAVWGVYLKWQLLHSAAPWLSRPFAQESFDFSDRYLGGVTEMKPRWKRCAESTDELLGEALGQKYVEKHFPPEAKAKALQLVQNLLAAMKDAIDELTWMSPETKRRALEKLATFNPKIGYPDKWLDYSKVEIRRDAFWANVAAGRRFGIADNFAQVGKPTDRARWGITPPTSNAYYNPLLNEIVFPAGILQPPAFSLEATDAVNYGAIGVVIGHEVSHGFDDQGARYDAQGMLRDWWTPADLAEFKKRGQCVVDQFDHYFIEPGLHHDGRLVLGESIGDLAGARIAFLAFKKAMAGKPHEPQDGFTPEQQFFLSWGQFRADNVRLEAQRKQVQSDPHPIAPFRVLGPLSNLPDFAQAFSCKAGAKMVRPPEQRCVVW